MTSLRVESLAIRDAVRGASLVLEHLLDQAVARITGGSMPKPPDVLEAIIAQLITSDTGAVDREMQAVVRAVGVKNRKLVALEKAPGLPQTLISSRVSMSGVSQPRAQTLDNRPIWQLAGLAAGASKSAGKRAVCLDEWLRRSVLMVDGRLSTDPHSPRCLWTLIHSECTGPDGVKALTTVASELAKAAPMPDFLAAFFCLEHGRRLDFTPENLAKDSPLRALPIAGAPRYGLAKAVPKRSIVPADFQPILFQKNFKMAVA